MLALEKALYLCIEVARQVRSPEGYEYSVLEFAKAKSGIRGFANTWAGSVSVTIQLGWLPLAFYRIVFQLEHLLVMPGY